MGICRGADIDISDKDDVSAIRYLVKNNDIDLLNIITNKSIEKYCTDETKITFDKITQPLDEKNMKICGDIMGEEFSKITLYLLNLNDLTLLTPISAQKKKQKKKKKKKKKKKL
eukprot:NODE_9393_length_371_cov_54.440994_g8490_i0.p1 GENE.NODE_9393_length_371_cov_54.440994_g8490_i0~~NODE_9393_length_371_cov_54.440994_g8490_i0.p1  ORF type:complete len:121 (-),score=27.02 NODE_9393_length_371_cov_54.440994_g8490_i0:8-349(-)